MMCEDIIPSPRLYDAAKREWHASSLKSDQLF